MTTKIGRAFLHLKRKKNKKGPYNRENEQSVGKLSHSHPFTIIANFLSFQASFEILFVLFKQHFDLLQNEEFLTDFVEFAA